MERATHKFLHFTSVFDFNVRLRGFVDDLEEEVLDIGLDLGISGFATNEALGVQDASGKREASYFVLLFLNFS